MKLTTRHQLLLRLRISGALPSVPSHVLMGWERRSLKFLLQVKFSLLKPTGHVMHQQFNVQQLYVLPTLYLCVLYLSENKQRLVTLTP